MMRNIKLLSNFVEKFMGTAKFGNDQIAPILGYGDLVQGNVTIKRVYYVEGLNHNLFFVGSHGTDIYSTTLQNTTSPNPICIMAKASPSQAWLWHCRLSHLNFDTINFLSKGLHAQVRTVRTDKGTKFLNKTLHAYFAQEGIEHQTSTARTLEQNGVVERRNHTLAEAARTMLSAPKVPLFFWAEAIATTYFTENYGENLDMMKEKAEIVTTSNELDLLFSLMFDELLNGTTLVVSKSSVVHAANAPNQRQQENTTPSTSTIVAADTPPLNIQTTHVTKSQAPTVIATKNINQAGTHEENVQVNEDEFINIFSTPVHEQGETSSRYLETNGEMCMFALIVSQTEPKNIKKAMADSAWIEAMKEELHQFNQFDVWELVDRPLCKDVS
ncbi:retrovirus-related pol polyprotein from transposon TNT 1-94 [Tanacetum coccineum]